MLRILKTKNMDNFLDDEEKVEVAGIFFTAMKRNTMGLRILESVYVCLYLCIYHSEKSKIP